MNQEQDQLAMSVSCCFPNVKFLILLLCFRFLVRQNSSPWSRLPRQTATPEEPHRTGELGSTWMSAHNAMLGCIWLYFPLISLQGFHVDTLSLDRVSALHEACLGSHYACAKFLLDSGANVRTFVSFYSKDCFWGVFHLNCHIWRTQKNLEIVHLFNYPLSMLSADFMDIISAHRCHLSFDLQQWKL